LDVRSTVQFTPDKLSHPTQLPNVDVPVGVAVNVTTVPLVKFALQALEQPSPAGELLTVPVPVPAKSTVSVGWAPLPPKPGHPGVFMSLTVTTIVEVMSAPEELLFPVLWFVCTVAETSAPPHADPVGKSTPVGVTVATVSVFEAQVTLSVISFVTAG